MPNTSILETLHEVRARTPALKDFLELCKPKVVLVLLLTALVGMFLATPGGLAARGVRYHRHWAECRRSCRGESHHGSEI